MANSVRVPKHLRSLKAAIDHIEQERLDALKPQLPPWYVYDYQKRTMRTLHRMAGAALLLLIGVTGAIEWRTGTDGKLGHNPGFIISCVLLMLLGAFEKIVLPFFAERWMDEHAEWRPGYSGRRWRGPGFYVHDDTVDTVLDRGSFEAEARRRLANFADEQLAKAVDPGAAYREGRTYLRIAIVEKPREDKASHAWQTPYDELVALTETTLRAKT